MLHLMISVIVPNLVLIGVVLLIRHHSTVTSAGEVLLKTTIDIGVCVACKRVSIDSKTQVEQGDKTYQLHRRSSRQPAKRPKREVQPK